MKAAELRQPAYLFVAPAVLLLTLLMILPLLVVVYLSLTDYTLASVDHDFIGLANFSKAFSEVSTVKALANTLLYVAIVVPVSVAIGLALALLVHRRQWSRRAYEVIFFLPVTSTMVAMAVVFQYLLHGRIGPVNAVIIALGFEPVDFLTSPATALYALMGIGVWQFAGFTMVIFLAGLTAIPRDIHEAAALDGADGGFDKFWRFTFPLLAPTTLFVVITTSITAFQVFDTVAVLTKGGPARSTEVLLYRIYQEGFQYFEIGYASALIIVFLIFVLAFALVQFWFAERRIQYGGQ